MVSSRKKQPKYSAANEFKSAASYMKGTDIEKQKRKLRNAELTIEKMERVEFDSDDGTEVVWLMGTDGFDLPFRVNKTNGRALAEDLGDDILAWEGSSVCVSANKTAKGWGVTITAVVDEEDSGELPDEEDEDDDLE